MPSKNLLVELLVEELPPKSLKKLGEVFGGAIEASLVAQDLMDQEARGFFPVDASTQKPIQYFASPRRLAVQLAGVKARADSKKTLQKLMPISIGLDQSGNPTTLSCAYGYKVSWTSGTNSASVVLSY